MPDRTLEPRNLTVAIKNIARACGDEISEVQPLLDARLEDGSRVAAMFPPCAVAGPALTIRKFTRRYSLDDLVAVGTLTPTSPTQLTDAVGSAAEHPDLRRHRHGQDDAAERAGGAIPDDDRIVVIEETAEIHLDKPNLLRFEARRAQAPSARNAAAAGDDLRPRPRDAAPSARSDPRRRGARRRSVRPAAGAQHGPSRQPQHDSRELGRAGADAAGPLRPDRQCRPAAPERPGSDCAGHPPGRAHRADQWREARHRSRAPQGYDITDDRFVFDTPAVRLPEGGAAA